MPALQPAYLLATATLLTLGGCAISNQGAVDYRYHRPGAADGKLTVKNIYAKDATHIFKAGDPIAISLKTVFIKDLTEFATPLRLARGDPATGDVAIVTSTCESPCARKQGSEGIRSSKVIFYSNDVRENQFLNLANLSNVYGPMTYNGNPFKLDVFIIELDESGAQVRQMLGSLANLGKTFYPPAHPAASVLSALADTFIKDEQDDNAFTYSFDLVGMKKRVSPQNPTTGYLESGDYVLIRTEDRNTSPPWDSLVLNTSTGRLIDTTCKADMNNPCDYRGNSYVVLEVRKAEGAQVNDSQQLVFSALKSQLEGEAGNREITPERIEIIKASLESAENRNETKNYLADIQDSDADTPRRRTAALNFVSTWFDPAITVTAQDKVTVIQQANELFGSCLRLTSTQVIKYQDEILKRKLSNKAEFLDALELCRQPKVEPSQKTLRP